MKRRLRAPSPALVISMIALFVALGGTSLAASRVIATKHKDAKADTKLVKKLAPKLSVKHAKTANSATTAASATHATSADSAATATSADNATNASAVGGLSATQLQKRVTGTCAAGSAVRLVNTDGTVTCETVGTTVLWAVVNSDGTLARGTATGSSRLATGQYEVDFNRDVTACAYNATIGSATTLTAVGDISVAPRSSVANGVFVFVHNSDGTAVADEPFHLMVVC